jgi:hypothetical protein
MKPRLGDLPREAARRSSPTTVGRAAASRRAWRDGVGHPVFAAAICLSSVAAAVHAQDPDRLAATLDSVRVAGALAHPTTRPGRLSPHRAADSSDLEPPWASIDRRAVQSRARARSRPAYL